MSQSANSNRCLITLLKSGAAPLALGLATLSATANAQEAEKPATDTASDIIVTGSRIARPDLQAASPVNVVTSETLKVTNTATAETYLSSLPQFVPATTSATNNGADGTATVDLRSLGSRRTLVLIDGRRLTPSDINGSVDVNTVPTALIKRVEILTGGASSVYGADAIAGVVNFVLDDKFTGFSANASQQITQHGDAKQADVEVAAGFNLGSSTHLVLGGQYTKRDGVYESARDYAAQNLDDQLQPAGSSNTVPTAIDIASGRYQINDGSQPGGNGTLVPYYHDYNYNPANYLITPLKKWSFIGILTHDFSDKVQAYVRGTYTRSDVTDILAPTATGGYNFTISPTNPYLLANPANYALIFGDPANLNPDGTANVGIRRRIIETGGRIENHSSEAYQVVGGFKGDIGDKFHWNAFAQYGASDRHIDHLNDLSYTRTSQAIDAVSTPGGAACADPSGGCVPLNLFTTQPISPAALSFVLANGTEDRHYDQLVAGGDVSGTLSFLKSPWADNGAAVSLGVEYRRESGSQSVDDAYGSGDLIYYGQGTAVPNASFNVKEVFGEFKMPLAADRPFVHSLGLEAGIRYSAYTNHTTGGTNKYNAVTWKLGGDWEPVAGLRLRAIFNRAIRDPNINELNAPLTQFGTDVLTVDPCADGLPRANPALAAKCIAQGAPADLVNNGVIQKVTSNQVNILEGGNGKLKPERSDTWTVGAVIAPPGLPGLHITVDYYKIKIADYINPDTAQDIFNQCFVGNISSYCALIVRNTITGQLDGSVTAGVQEVFANVAKVRTEGIDVTADYRVRLPHNSSLLLSLAGTYVRKWEFTSTVGAIPAECAGRFGNLCEFANGNPIPKWKHIASATYENGPASLYVAWRFVSSVTEDAGTNILASKIPSYSWYDATLGFRVTKQFTLHVGVQNLLNSDPPIVGGSAGSSGTNAANTFPQVYDPLGRTFFANVSLKF